MGDATVDVNDKTLKKNNEEGTSSSGPSKSRDLVGNRHQWIEDKFVTHEQPKAALPESDTPIVDTKLSIESNEEIEVSTETFKIETMTSHTIEESFEPNNDKFDLSGNDGESSATVSNNNDASVNDASQDVANELLTAASCSGEYHVPGKHKYDSPHESGTNDNTGIQPNPRDSMNYPTDHRNSPSDFGSDHRDAINCPAQPTSDKETAHDEPLVLDFPAEMIDPLPQENDNDEIPTDEPEGLIATTEPSDPKCNEKLDEDVEETDFKKHISPNTENNLNLEVSADTPNSLDTLRMENMDLAADVAIPACSYSSTTNVDSMLESFTTENFSANKSQDVALNAGSFRQTCVLDTTVKLGCDNFGDHCYQLESAKRAFSSSHNNVEDRHQTGPHEIDQNANVMVSNVENVMLVDCKETCDPTQVFDLDEEPVNYQVFSGNSDYVAEPAAVVDGIGHAGSSVSNNMDEKESTDENKSYTNINNEKIAGLGVDELIVDDPLVSSRNEEMAEPKKTDQDLTRPESISLFSTSNQEGHPSEGDTDLHQHEDNLNESVQYVSITTSIDEDDVFETQLEPLNVSVSDDTPVFLGDLETPHKYLCHADQSDAYDDDIRGSSSLGMGVKSSGTKSDDGLLFLDTTEETVMASNSNHQNENKPENILAPREATSQGKQPRDSACDERSSRVKDIVTSMSSESNATYGLTPLAHVVVHSSPKVVCQVDQTGVNKHRVDISKMDFLSTRKGKAYLEQAKKNAKKLREMRDDIVNDQCCAGLIPGDDNKAIPVQPIPSLIDEEKTDHEATDSSDVHYLTNQSVKDLPSPSKRSEADSSAEVQMHCLDHCSIM